MSFVHDSTDEVFVTNFATYFDKESVIRYYILVLVLGLVDSLGKNMKLCTFDGIKWEIQLYDADTAFGLIIAQIKSTLINGESPEMDNAQEENLLTLTFIK